LAQARAVGRPGLQVTGLDGQTAERDGWMA